MGGKEINWKAEYFWTSREAFPAPRSNQRIG